jgi:hypothetical protein
MIPVGSTAPAFGEGRQADERHDVAPTELSRLARPPDSALAGRRVLAADDPRHGTLNGYTNLGCRCDRCRQANTIACRPRQEAWRRRRGIMPRKLGRTHGLRSTYNAGCRCEPCRGAEREYRTRRRNAS